MCITDINLCNLTLPKLFTPDNGLYTFCNYKAFHEISYGRYAIGDSSRPTFGNFNVLNVRIPKVE
jgi:hypothetical protein